MPRFRKRPVVIEAMQVPMTSEGSDLVEWGRIGLWLSGITREWQINDSQPQGIDIRTLEGTMTANPGDWVIRGVQGEIYPCKPDIFAQTYEPAD